MLPMTTHPAIKASGCRSQGTRCFWAFFTANPLPPIWRISRLLFLSLSALFASFTANSFSAISAVTNTLAAMEVNHAVMVTVELDLGSPVPSIAEGLREVERKYQPDDGRGRTFAILDAYG